NGECLKPKRYYNHADMSSFSDDENSGETDSQWIRRLATDSAAQSQVSSIDQSSQDSAFDSDEDRKRVWPAGMSDVLKELRREKEKQSQDSTDADSQQKEGVATKDEREEEEEIGEDTGDEEEEEMEMEDEENEMEEEKEDEEMVYQEEERKEMEAEGMEMVDHEKEENIPESEDEEEDMEDGNITVVAAPTVAATAGGEMELSVGADSQMNEGEENDAEEEEWLAAMERRREVARRLKAALNMNDEVKSTIRSIFLLLLNLTTPETSKEEWKAMMVGYASNEEEKRDGDEQVEAEYPSGDMSDEEKKAAHKKLARMVVTRQMRMEVYGSENGSIR
ncbi:hypothetical protein PENTCL1PPCAC_19675, partial [Pristionchus entomophagus]